MTFEEFETKGFIGRARINFKQIYNFLSRAKKDLLTSQANLAVDEEWSYTIAYHAMLRAGRALMLSFGYRPKGKDQHITVVLFTSKVLGDQSRALMRKFDRMRRKRHDLVYETERPVSRQEAEQAIVDAEALVKEIWHFVKEKDPQTGSTIEF